MLKSLSTKVRPDYNFAWPDGIRRALRLPIMLSASIVPVASIPLRLWIVMQAL